VGKKSIKFFTYLFISFLPILFVVAQKNDSPPIDKEKQSLHAAFRLVLPTSLRKVYDSIKNDSARVIWEARYWKANDPTPSTPENEYRKEFLKRFYYSYEHFSNLTPPLYFDDRGKFYIRLGAPSDFVESVGVGKRYRSNLTWAYYKFNLYIDFVDMDFYGYKEVSDLSEAIRGNQDKFTNAAELYVERETLNAKYGNFRRVLHENELSRQQMEFYNLQMPVNAEKERIMKIVPEFVYNYDYKAKPMKAYIRSSTFKGENGKTRVEIYYGIPLDQITFVSGEKVPLKSNIDKRINIYDKNIVDVINNETRLNLSATSINNIKGRLYINQDTYFLKPGVYNTSLRLYNTQGNKLAILKAQLQVKDFSSDNKLMVSNIELGSKILENSTSPLSKKNGILVVPYLYKVIRKGIPIFLYFEIYNLTPDNSGECKYRVEYKIKTLERGGGIISNSIRKITSTILGRNPRQEISTSFTGNSYEKEQQIYLQLDLSSADIGTVNFSIQVTDMNNNNYATSNIDFRLIK